MLIRIMTFIAVILTWAVLPVNAVDQHHRNFSIGTGQALQSRPTLALDSRRNRFLSVWGDLRNLKPHSVDVYGRIVDANGEGTADDFPIAVGPAGQSNPVAVYDDINDRFLVVWTDWRDAKSVDSDIYGRWLTPDSKKQGDEFPIAALRGVSQVTPNVVYDSSRQRFLVVWGDNRENKQIYKIYGRFLDADGSMKTDAFRLSEGGEGSEDGPSVSYDNKRKRFFAIWRDIKGSYPNIHKTIYGRIIDADKGLVARQQWIAFEDDACLPPSLHAADFAQEQDVFLVTWTSARHYHDEISEKIVRGLDVYGVLIEAENGNRRGEDFAIATEADYQEFSAVAFDPHRKRFLVVWYDLRRPPAGKSMDIYGRYISLDGGMSDEFLISDPHSPGIRRFPNLVYAPQSKHFFIVWEDAREPGINKRRVYGHIK